MTHAEFAKGWKLLILQPWGKPYRGITEEGTLSEEAKTQMDFYFERLHYAHPDAWMTTAKLFAEGKQWPALSEVRETLWLYHRRCIVAVADQSHTTDRIPMPEEIRKKLQQDGLLKTMPKADDE